MGLSASYKEISSLIDSAPPIKDYSNFAMHEVLRLNALKKNMPKNQWQTELATLYRDALPYVSSLELDQSLADGAERAQALFPFRVPKTFAALIEKGNPNDPLLKQILPTQSEFQTEDGYTQDPLGEMDANPVPGLLHKYRSRVLVTLTSACAIHCRYCFRRHFPYEKNNPGIDAWSVIFDYIKANHAINEVILSGGDPLTLPDKTLQSFVNALAEIKHIRRLRFHTRVPIVMPARITDVFCLWLQSAAQRFSCVMVVHANHPNEISVGVQETLLKLHQYNVMLFNQSVLLKGVNDNVQALAQLSEKLFAAKVTPYYLHMLDKVAGAQHFAVSAARAKAIHAELRAALPGFLVPRLVTEEAGREAKTWL